MLVVPEPTELEELLVLLPRAPYGGAAEGAVTLAVAVEHGRLGRPDGSPWHVLGLDRQALVD